MPQDTRVLRLAAEIRCLGQATEFAREGARAAGLPEVRWGQVDLVVEEIFVNIATYAYRGGKGEVEMQYEASPGMLEVELADQGEEYDPLTLREPNLPATLAERAVGGLGIFLVRQMADSVEYRREAGWNRLRFRMEAAPET